MSLDCLARLLLAGAHVRPSAAARCAAVAQLRGRDAVLGRRPGSRRTAALAGMRCASGSVSMRRPSRRRRSRRRRSRDADDRVLLARRGSTTAIRSPSFRSLRVAVAASIATSSARCGMRPCLTVNASKRGGSAIEAMKFGAPPAPMRSPFLSSTRADVEDRAVGALHARLPADLREDRRRDGRRRAAVVRVSIVLRGVIDASVPFADSVKILSNELLIVSVKTYVPAISVTPRATASAVRTSRSLRAKSPRRATLRTNRPPSSGRGRRRRCGRSPSCTITPSASTSRRSA